MIKLTREQNDLLFDVTEHHLKWYSQFNKYMDIPSFASLLRLNHEKMNHFWENTQCSTQDITDKLFELKKYYIAILNDKKNDSKI